MRPQPPEVDALHAGLRRARDGLLWLGRLRAAALLGEPSMAGKREHAAEAALRVDQAARLQRYLERSVGREALRVAWPVVRGEAQGTSLAAASQPVAAVELALARELGQLAQSAEATLLAEPARRLLLELAATLPAPGGAPIAWEPGVSPAAAERALRGPRSSPLDPIFTPAFSLLDGPEPTGPADADRAPAFWCLSIREVMAAELCALCLLEYDGLPLAFYEDFAKQCWDELRHAAFYLGAAVRLLPEFIAGARADHPLLPGARAYLATGRGLGVPVEGNLYEVAWATSLEERLVLMHLDTEAPSIADLRRDLGSAFVRARPWLQRDLALTAFDEASHALIGARWLSALVPDRQERRELVERTRMLRGLYLASAIAARHGLPLPKVVSRLTERAQAATPVVARREEVLG